MPAENADYIHQLNPEKPTGGESISDGDDHLRAIKTAVTGTFKEVKGEVTATHTDLNAVSGLRADVAQLKTDVGAIDAGGHGNVASCYYNPSVGSGAAGLVYKHNVTNVSVDPDGAQQTRVTFETGLDGDADSISHFAFNITPVSATGYATLVTITATLPGYISFIAWHQVGDVWEIIPPTQCGFSLMVVDMDKSQ